MKYYKIEVQTNKEQLTFIKENKEDAEKLQKFLKFIFQSDSIEIKEVDTCTLKVTHI